MTDPKKDQNRLLQVQQHLPGIYLLRNVRLKLKHSYSGFGTFGFDSFLLLPKPIRVSARTGIPLDVLPTRGLSAKQAERISRINDSDLPRVSTQARDRQESREERKARKQAIKEERKVKGRHNSRQMFPKPSAVTEPKLKEGFIGTFQERLMLFSSVMNSRDSDSLSI